MHMTMRKVVTVLDRAIIGALLILVVLLLGVQIARAGELIPALGWTRAINGDQTKMFGSLAFRGDLLPFLKSEVGAGYRSESKFDEQLKVRMWPVTASLWITPLPTLYAGGGVGWYHTTFDYDQSKIAFPIADQTKEEFGVHLGGGMQVPLAPFAAIDVNGRYVMMRDQQSRLVPEKFNPDFWSSSLGLAFKF